MELLGRVFGLDTHHPHPLWRGCGGGGATEDLKWLWVDSGSEPDVGPELMNCEIMTRVRVRSLTN